MGIYVVEIEGKAIAAYGDSNLPEAEAWFEGDPFKSDLLSLEHSDGSMLWNGKSKLNIRKALPDEAEKWRSSLATAVRMGDQEPDDNDWLAFLAPVREPK